MGLWASNYEKGITGLIGGKTIKIDESTGLLSNNISAIHSDSENLYIGTAKGLSVCKIDQLIAEDFALYPFLINKTIYNIKSDDKFLFVATNEGIFSDVENGN